MSSDTAIRVEGLGKRYRIGATRGIARYRSLREDVSQLVTRSLRKQEREEKRDFWALKDVSFEVKQGESVGIIGRNGAGKSTLLKILARITPPTAGRGGTFGRVGSLLEVGTGFHPELTGRENIMLAGAIMGMRRAEIFSRFDEIVEFSGLSRFLETPVKRYSSGMYMRLAFSVAAHLEPEILLVDEVLAVGDADFQKKCLGRMENLSGSGRAVLFVSHSMASVLRLCDRVILLDHGGVRADGPGSRVVEEYLGDDGGSTSMKWPATDAAPGDAQVRLRSVRVVGPESQTGPEIDIRSPISIEVLYEHRSDDPHFRPTCYLVLRNSEGTELFHTVDSSNFEWRSQPRKEGLVRMACEIPGNFLAEGYGFVGVGIYSLQPMTKHLHVPDAVVFHVVDHSETDGARGDWPGAFGGVLRPMLTWTADTDPLETR
jgi:lipopolysaccharide transport system ATP-binding protein